MGRASGRVIAMWFPAGERGIAGAIFNSAQYLSLAVFTPLVRGVSTGSVTDWLHKCTGALTLARRLPITIGLLMTASMIGCNFVHADWMVIGLMSLAFFGKGLGSLGWTVVADTAPKAFVCLTGGVFNAIGDTAGITTPLVIGYILGATGSFHYALVFVGMHGIVAVLSYWFIVGKIERFSIARAGRRRHAAGFRRSALSRTRLAAQSARCSSRPDQGAAPSASSGTLLRALVM